MSDNVENIMKPTPHSRGLLLLTDFPVSPEIFSHWVDFLSREQQFGPRCMFNSLVPDTQKKKDLWKGIYDGIEVYSHVVVYVTGLKNVDEEKQYGGFTWEHVAPVLGKISPEQRIIVCARGASETTQADTVTFLESRGIKSPNVTIVPVGLESKPVEVLRAAGKVILNHPPDEPPPPGGVSARVPPPNGPNSPHEAKGLVA